MEQGETGGLDAAAAVLAKRTTREEKKNERKAASNRTNDAEAWHACKYWMKVKTRFCNMKPCPGAIWCGVHLHQVEVEYGGLSPGRTAPVPAEYKGDLHKTLLCLAEAAKADAPEGRVAEDGGGEVELRRKESKGKRIPCPHDPRHTIYEKDLFKHLASCPMYKRQMEIESQPCFSRNINLNEGAAALSKAQGQLAYEEDVEDVEEEEAKMLRGEVGDKMKQPLLKEVAKGVDFNAFAEQIGRVYDQLVGEIPVEALRPEYCEKLFAAADTEARDGQKLAHDKMRHLQQQCSIVGHMGRKGLLGAETYLEMGAGKAGLSDTLTKAVDHKARLCVIERAGCRYKSDKNMRGPEGSDHFRRLRMDIAHLNLAALDFAQVQPGMRGDVVTIGKHLCGGATDLALSQFLIHSHSRQGRVTTHTFGTSAQKSSPPLVVAWTGGGELVLQCITLGCVVKTLPGSETRLKGVAIATCCHHRCDDLSYVNMGYIDKTVAGEGRGWGIELVSLVSSWACCCFAKGKASRSSAQPGAGGTTGGRGGVTEERVGAGEEAGVVGGGLSDEEKERLGIRCKRLLDWGRVLWLREQGLEATLVHYCGPEATPENCLLLAWRPGSDGTAAPLE